MSDVVATALLGSPVFRMQAVLRCRDVGTSAHRAIEQLQAAGVDQAHMAALLGLRETQLATLLSALDGDSGQRVSELRVWIDPAHRTVFSTDSGLELVPHMRYQDIPLLRFPIPVEADLPPESYSRAASTRESVHKRVIVEEVHDLTRDIRARTAVGANGKRGGTPTDYLLLLPDTLLVVRRGPAGIAIEVQWRGTPDAELTEAAQAKLQGDRALDPRRLTTAWALQAQARLHTALGTTPEEARRLSLDPLVLRRNMLDAIADAEQQIAIAVDAPEAAWPAWLRRALREASDRGVRWLTNSPPKHGSAKGNGAEQAGRLRKVPGCGILLVRDGDSALAYSDACPLGGRWEERQLASQACLKAHDPQSVRRLLNALGAPTLAPRRRQASAVPLEDVAVDALRAALEVQRAELPTASAALIEEGDVQAFCETVRLENIDPDNAARVRMVADGVAWERVLYTECLRLAALHPQLEIVDFRREAPVEAIDLDVIMSNVASGCWWILDAKRKSEVDKRKQLRTMKLQLKIAHERGWIPDDLLARGAIVFPLDANLSAAEDRPDIAYITIAQLEHLLLGPPEREPGDSARDLAPVQPIA